MGVEETPPKISYFYEWETLCAILRRVRKEKGFMQEKLGKLLGRQQNLIAKIEPGERKLDLCQLLDYFDVLGADPVAVIAELVKESKTKKR